MLNCRYCNSIRKNKNSLRNHERLCKANPNKQIMDWAKGENQYTKAYRLGLEKPELLQSTRTKLSLAAIKGNLERIESEETKEKRRNTIGKKIEEGTWHTSYNKGRIFEYNGLKLDSSWEVKYAEYLDRNNIEWTRNKRYFKYEFEGKTRRYYPDFYLISTNEFVEIKGFTTDMDIEKWKQFPQEEKLIILMRAELELLGIKV